MYFNDITKDIIRCAYKVHNKLGTGFLEKVYENALKIELEKEGFKVFQQHPIHIYYDDKCIGEYYADLMVEDIIIELKAVEEIHPKHEVQLVNYLTATGIDVGLLINFSSSVKIKRKYREYKNQD
ncbi:MAG: GxxExxY protein [Prevotellaceae bacterium]|jgi:GxxExxY protein|nr:GxxExxY protein [Prevotellaceae bacterium]